MKINVTQGSIKTLEIFADTIKTAIEATYGEDYKVSTSKVNKTNDVEFTGISISHKNSNIAPVIYLDEFFKDYQNGVPLELICKRVIEIYKNNKISFDVSYITDFEKIKNDICYKIINTDRNKKLLSNVPYIEIKDLSIVFYILINEKSLEGQGSITVSNEMLKKWNVDINTLKKVAFYNTEKKFKASICSMEDTLRELMALSYCEDEYFVSDFAKEVPMFVCSNTQKVNGACVFIYKNLLQTLARKLDSDIYILPSSIHETILIPVNAGMDINHLKGMVKEINSFAVAPNEILSDNVYCYNRAANKINIE